MHTYCWDQQEHSTSQSRTAFGFLKMETSITQQHMRDGVSTTPSGHQLMTDACWRASSVGDQWHEMGHENSLTIPSWE